MANWTSDAPVCDVPCPFGHGGVRRRIVDTIWEADGASEYQCAECEMVFLYPIMTIEEEEEFYRVEFEKYMAERGQAGGVVPAESYRSWQPEGERRLALIRNYLRDGMGILELGSATGYLLDAIRPVVGSDVTGIEPGEAFRAFAIDELGITTHASRDAVSGDSFDILLAYYVVEHLRDPVGELADWHALLRPGGKCIIEVPNVDDALVKYWKVEAFDRFYWQKAHYFNYSHKTLSMVLKMAGFKDVVTVPVQRYDMSNHLHWIAKGKGGGGGQYSTLLDERVDTEYRRSLKEHWLCDTVMAVATA